MGTTSDLIFAYFLQVGYRGLVRLRLGIICFTGFLYLLNGFYSSVNFNLIFRIQLSVNVQIPREFGGLGGKAIYVGMFL